MKNIKYSKVKNKYGFTSTSPLPSPIELEEFYAQNYYQAPQNSTYQQTYDDLELSYKNLKCEALLNALCAASTSNLKRFLDVGAGEGFLLNAASEAGFNVTGLDFSSYGVGKFFPHLAESLIAGDIYKSLMDLNLKGCTYDFSVSTNVLEHVIDPSLFLKHIKKVMTPNGLLAITVPNDYSPIQNLALSEKMINREFWFVPPHHLHYFNAKTLVTLLEDCEFEIIDAFSDFPVDLFLLHSGSNYIMNPSAGYEVNRTRMHHDIMLVKNCGIENYLQYYRAMFKVGLGRDITVIARCTR